MIERVVSFIADYALRDNYLYIKDMYHERVAGKSRCKIIRDWIISVNCNV